MIRTITAVVFLALAIFLVLPWVILWGIFAHNPDFIYWTSVSGIRIANRILGFRVHREGLENIPPGVCIFVSNHASNVDPPVLIPAIPRRISILTKKEVFRIPFLGSAMRRVKFISVNRANREAAARSVDLAIQYLKEGISFAVFAEGTRSPDGRLKKFKKGPFIMAIESGVPIVPVSLIGTQNLMRKGDWAVQTGDVIVRFGPPVGSSQYSIAQRGELRDRIQTLVAAGLPSEQKPLSSSNS
jgi:1-acyl-sn-glycerol-3-phosphate acyltransferase